MPINELEELDKKVIKANDLIQKSRFNLSLQQQKIVLYLISQITPFDDDFKLYEFTITDFCKVCGIDHTSGKNYTDLKDAIKEIADKSIWITLGKTETLVRWIEKPYIERESGKIKIKLDNDLKPFLLQLKENFTSYEIIWTLHFKSKFSIRLYELIKSIHFHELEEYTREYKLTDLRRLLDAEHYSNWINLRQRVLEPALKEINEYSDKNVRMETIKEGKAIHSVRFIITSKDTLETEEIRDRVIKEMGFQQMTLWDMMEEKGLVSKRNY